MSYCSSTFFDDTSYNYDIGGWVFGCLEGGWGSIHVFAMLLCMGPKSMMKCILLLHIALTERGGGGWRLGGKEK